MILTPQQVTTMQRGIAGANHLLPRIEFLVSMAAVMPEIQERVQELRVKRDYLAQLCETALDMNKKLTEAIGGGNGIGTRY